MCQKANRSYQKDLASFREARESNAQAIITEDPDDGPGQGSTMPGGDKIGFLFFVLVLSIISLLDFVLLRLLFLLFICCKHDSMITS